MRRACEAVALLALSLFSMNALAQSFLGTWSAQGSAGPVVLSVQQDAAGTVTGTLSGNGATMHLNGAMEEQGMAVGSLSDDQGMVFFAMTIQGDRLMFTIMALGPDGNLDEENARVIAFSRGEAPAPAPAPPAAPPPADDAARRPPPTAEPAGTPATAPPAAAKKAAPPSKPPADGQVYRHPVGFTFRYPKGWKAQDTGDFLRLVPPNEAKAEGGSAEVYGVWGESVAAEGIPSAADPRNGQYIDGLMSQRSPPLRRQGEAQNIALGQGTGAKLTWSGEGAGGKPIVAVAYVAVIGNLGVSLFAVGLSDPVEKRRQDMEAMFGSFSVGEAQRDPSLVGNWSYFGTTAITNNSVWETDYSRAQLASDRKGTLSFSPDGSYRRVDSSHMIVGAGDVWLEDKSEEKQQGQWFAADGNLTLVDDKGNTYEYQYRVEQGAGKLLLGQGSKGTVWKRE